MPNRALFLFLFAGLALKVVPTSYIKDLMDRCVHQILYLFIAICEKIALQKGLAHLKPRPHKENILSDGQQKH